MKVKSEEWRVKNQSYYAPASIPLPSKGGLGVGYQSHTENTEITEISPKAKWRMKNIAFGEVKSEKSKLPAAL